MFDALDLFPPGPWHPDDLAFARREVDRYLATGAGGCYILLVCLLAKPSPETDALIAPVVDAVAASGGDSERSACRHLSKSRGLPPSTVELLGRAFRAPRSPSSPKAQPNDE